MFKILFMGAFLIKLKSVKLMVLCIHADQPLPTKILSINHLQGPYDELHPIERQSPSLSRWSVYLDLL